MIAEKIKTCIALLNEIKGSGYIPFTSPAPSSTEARIKNNITSALSHLESALNDHQKVFKS